MRDFSFSGFLTRIAQCLALSLTLAALPCAAASPPNMLVVLVDDLRSVLLRAKLRQHLDQH